jgi:UDP-N-acetylmuramoylalanine--D-glutamate ligase
MQSDKLLKGFVGFLETEVSGKKVLILGFGKEGQSTFSFFKAYLPMINLAVADMNSSIFNHPLLKHYDSNSLYFGKRYESALDEFDLIIKSPGVNIKDNWKVESKLTSQTNLFLRFFKDKVIGVTGTKGKSTTSSLIYHILTKAGKNPILLGNIGLPSFDMIAKIKTDSLVVFELSAHQLEFVTTSPRIAVLLNVFPEHLDYFHDFDGYRRAKENIFRFQSLNDTLVVHETLLPLIKGIPSIIKYFGPDEPRMKGGQIKALANSSTTLPGKHNLLNIKAALLVAMQVNIDLDFAIQSLLDFKSLPHRLEYVGNFQGIEFYNDSISTVPESTIAAVETLKNVDTLILGGFDRGLDYSKLATHLSGSTISNYLFLGKAGEIMKLLFGQLKLQNVNLIKVDTLKEAFQIIPEITSPGRICLLSPAAASYDQFHSFEHRGDTFKMLASNL